ncbi:MAG TPA: hypothetical protein VG500_01075 [Gemmatimonadales bacterium]|jgi:hypothetical protein|nr:hypothetical protein [Gemmatimonadales bacterium]
MRRRLLSVALALTGSALVLPAAAAQGPTPLEAAAMLRLGAGAAGEPGPSPALGRAPILLPDSAVRQRKDHTVTGLLIGAGLGFAAGWAFYDLICEAVDNRCADSRWRLLIPGTAVGGALGALIGSLSG